MAGHIGQCCCDWRMATTTALRFAVAPMRGRTRRSRAGRPRPARASAATACSEAIECTVLSVRKRWGSQIPKIRMNRAHRYRPLKRSNPKPGRLPVILMCPAAFPGRGSPRSGKQCRKTRGSTLVAGALPSRHSRLMVRAETSPPSRSAAGRPSRHTITRWQMAASSSTSEELITMAAPAAAACTSWACSTALAPTSTPWVGSSSRNTAGSRRSHLREHDLLLVAAAERLQGQVDQARRPDAEPLEPAERRAALGPAPHRAEPAERPQAGQRDVFPSREAQDRRVPYPVRRQVGQAVPHGQVRPGRREPYTASGQHLAGPAGGPEGGAQHRFAA